MKKYFWETFSDEELLDVRLCDLGLKVKGSRTELYLNKLYSELGRKGLNFKPHAWIGDDWYSPDGIPGISIPFFVIHPRLAKLELNMIGEVEGGTSKWFMQLLRHEAGHAIDNAFRLRKLKKRQALFGLSSENYPEEYEPRPYSKNYVRHLEGNYAQAHPDEDWAETFAVWLTPGSKWKSKYRNWGALKKLSLLDKIMQGLIGKTQPVQNKRVLTPISKSHLTLREFYHQKRRRLNLERPFFPAHLRKLFSTEVRFHQNPTASSLIRSERREICQKVAKQTNQYQYRINKMLNDLASECAKNNLRLKTSKQMAKRELIGLLPKQANTYLKNGRHRIIM